MNEKKRISPVIEEIVSTEKLEVVDEEKQEEKQADVKQEDKAKEIIAELEKLQFKPEKVGHKLNLKFLLLLTIMTALVVGFVVGGIYVYVSKISLFKSHASPTPTPIQAVLPTLSPSQPTLVPSPAPVDVSVYKISILNGSGKVGEAGRAQAVLEKAGFEVLSVGNAANYNYKNTLLQAKASVPEAVVAKLRETLTEDYSVDEDLGTPLPSSSAYDLIVIVGVK